MIQFVFQHHCTLAAVLRTDSMLGKIVQQVRDEDKRKDFTYVEARGFADRLVVRYEERQVQEHL